MQIKIIINLNSTIVLWQQNLPLYLLYQIALLQQPTKQAMNCVLFNLYACYRSLVLLLPEATAQLASNFSTITIILEMECRASKQMVITNLLWKIIAAVYGAALSTRSHKFDLYINILKIISIQRKSSISIKIANEIVEIALWCHGNFTSFYHEKEASLQQCFEKILLKIVSIYHLKTLHKHILNITTNRHPKKYLK